MRYQDINQLPSWREFVKYYGDDPSLPPEYDEAFEAYGIEFEKGSDYFRWLKRHFRKMGSEIIAYRGLFSKMGHIPHKVKKKKLVDIIVNSERNLGTHWSENKLGMRYILIAKIPISSIDWLDTIVHRFHHPLEKEFTLIGPVTLVQIEDYENNNQVLWTGNKVMKTK